MLDGHRAVGLLALSAVPKIGSMKLQLLESVQLRILKAKANGVIGTNMFRHQRRSSRNNAIT